MTLRPALVDPHGGPMTGNRGGPIPLAKPAATWSHAAGKRHSRREQHDGQDDEHGTEQAHQCGAVDPCGGRELHRLY